MVIGREKGEGRREKGEGRREKREERREKGERSVWCLFPGAWYGVRNTEYGIQSTMSNELRAENRGVLLMRLPK
jgi:hypothetical protein